MSILFKYIIREIIKNFSVVLATVVGIFLVVDLFQKIDNFIEASLPLPRCITFLQYKVPFVVAQIMPVGVLLSVLIVFGMMSRKNEVIALKSSGVSIYFLLKPVICIGIFFSLLLFLLVEVIVPVTESKANKIWWKEVEKKSTVVSRDKNIWMKGNRSITHIKFYNPKSRTIKGISLNVFDEDFKLVRRVDAKRAVFNNGVWVLHELMEQTLDASTGSYQVRYHPKMVEPLELMPDDLQRVIKKSEEMNYKELQEYIQQVEMEGYDATLYKVDLYAKVSFPFVCIILCLIGVGIAFKEKSKESLPVAIAKGIGIVFVYWFFHSFCLSLGYGGLLPPVVAAWIANLVFLVFGVLTILYAE